MYRGQEFSPATITTTPINATETRIYLDDVSIFQDLTLPNLMTLRSGEEIGEIVKVLAIGVNFIDVSRAVKGIAQEWPSGTPIARLFTSEDLDTLQDNVQGLGIESNQLSSDLSGLTDRVSNLDTNLGAAQTDIGVNTANITNLAGRMSSAESTLGSHTNTLAGLREDLTDAETAIAQNADDVKKANDSIADTNATLATKTGVYGVYEITVQLSDWKNVGNEYTAEFTDPTIPADNDDVVYFTYVNFDVPSLALTTKRITTSTKEGAFILHTDKLPKGTLTGTVLIFDALKGIAPIAGGMSELFDYIDEQMTQIKSGTKDYVDEQIASIEPVIQIF